MPVRGCVVEILSVYWEGLMAFQIEMLTDE